MSVFLLIRKYDDRKKSLNEYVEIDISEISNLSALFRSNTNVETTPVGLFVL
jgi:hypothetical protein